MHNNYEIHVLTAEPYFAVRAPSELVVLENQRLSKQRAESVREYLISQGIPADSVTSIGMGYSMPVASNDTYEGRQWNRRVELIVSGEVIDTAIGEI